jgi:hypothetical protein
VTESAGLLDKFVAAMTRSSAGGRGDERWLWYHRGWMRGSTRAACEYLTSPAGGFAVSRRADHQAGVVVRASAPTALPYRTCTPSAPSVARSRPIQELRGHDIPRAIRGDLLRLACQDYCSAASSGPNQRTRSTIEPKSCGIGLFSTNRASRY